MNTCISRDYKHPINLNFIIRTSSDFLKRQEIVAVVRAINEQNLCEFPLVLAAHIAAEARSRIVKIEHDYV